MWRRWSSQPNPNQLAYTVPLASIVALRSTPGRVLLDEGRLLGIGGIAVHQVVGKPLDLSVGNQPRKNRILDDSPADTGYDRRQRERDERPLHGRAQGFDRDRIRNEKTYLMK